MLSGCLKLFEGLGGGGETLITGVTWVKSVSRCCSWEDRPGYVVPPGGGREGGRRLRGGTASPLVNDFWLLGERTQLRTTGSVTVLGKLLWNAADSREKYSRLKFRIEESTKYIEKTEKEETRVFFKEFIFNLIWMPAQHNRYLPPWLDNSAQGDPSLTATRFCFSLFNGSSMY